MRLQRNLIVAAGCLSLGLGAWAFGQSTPAAKPTAKPETKASTKPAAPGAPKPATPAAAPKPPAPKDPNDVRPIPPLGTPLPPEDQAAVEKGAKELEAAIDELSATLQQKPQLQAYLPDVQIYYNAIHYGLKYNEFIAPKGSKDLRASAKQALAVLATGLERAKQLKAGQTPWATQSGPRGYVSKIDGSVQPYILFVPEIWKPGQAEPLPLALSCHGRNENLTELAFLSTKIDPSSSNSTVGDPKTKFVAMLYGRYCCANKLAGEIDLFETWERIAEQYPIDKARVSVTGFSMGGGALWHFAAHYGEKFCVATPGAGFSESQRFLKLAQNGEVPPWYESVLYRLYNATEHEENFFNTKTIAYAGDKDGQKQAGDVMEEALTKAGIQLERFIGPNTEHKYEPETKKKLDARVEELTKQGKDFLPQRVKFATYTLRYDSMLWLTVTGLEKHWQKATVDAEIAGGAAIKATTKNVSALFFKFPLKGSPFAIDKPITVDIDGQRVAFDEQSSLLGIYALRKTDGKWGRDTDPPTGLRKRHGLQGPIDDAFLSSFVIVRPTGKGLSEKTAGWAAKECDRAIGEWRKQFRGEARVKPSDQITDADIASSNLVLFGDPGSNPLIARVLPKLPIQWTSEKLVVNGKGFAGDRYVPVMIYPNPLNPTKYIVINSGFTFREADYLNNARQTPKLPDYAVIDTQTPPTKTSWGVLPKAGFFGEKWEWQADDGKIAP
ncbi:prolyl oligopeptidase family serine peptidase [Humisphaera borealis]|uniref:Prolyl oligopeptidase family serine peptidase n=1 Tax=Humisphaera borealis TaxID=2807512 RepID=A0A7M2WRK1_9BACT|nr:prolyl oligopeptidase family serine peptidase [Humisphaera borealis]QOV88053.1 prolyl oligopeptidase family serine peptidase [Humisphaera borealis]